MRERRSVNFASYYKIEWFDPYVTAWRGLQRKFTTLEDARQACMPDRACRVTAVSPAGRVIIEHVAQQQTAV